MPKAKHGNFTLKKIVAAVPADKAAHRMTALQRSGQYSELRFIQRGKGSFDIVGYKWPDKGTRRKFGIGRSKNPGVMSCKWQLLTVMQRRGCLLSALEKKVALDITDGTGEHATVSPRNVKRIVELMNQKTEAENAKWFNQSFIRWYWDAADMLAGEKNPSPAHGATPNQVNFGMRGKVKVGWISRKTPKRYEITYKEGATTKTVWRDKNKVTFAATKKRGKLPKKNPCMKTANPAIETRRAVELSKKFHGFDPRKIKEVSIEWPKSLTALGACVRVDYACDKWDGKDRIYFHDFEKPATVFAAPKSQKNGDNLLVIVGKFKITANGIEG